jgi:2-polyprenyl-6-methoxyphenol hydroxylase-like FAD-dependent oxidoreductase
VTAGLLVAADGYFSRVRRQAVGDGPPAYGKTVVWRARLPAASAVAAGLDLQDSSSAFVQDLGRFFFAYPISSGDYVWTVGISGEQARVLPVSGLGACRKHGMVTVQL